MAKWVLWGMCEKVIEGASVLAETVTIGLCLRLGLVIVLWVLGHLGGLYEVSARWIV